MEEESMEKNSSIDDDTDTVKILLAIKTIGHLATPEEISRTSKISLERTLQILNKLKKIIFDSQMENT